MPAPGVALCTEGGAGPAGQVSRTWPAGELAEADGNRTRLAEMLGHVGFRGRGGHQTP